MEVSDAEPNRVRTAGYRFSCMMRYLQSGVLAFSVLLAGCARTERIVRVVASDDHKPVTNRVFRFSPSSHLNLEPLFKPPPNVTTMLDSNGEARVRFPRTHGWAQFGEGDKSYAVRLKQADITRGGEFRLYGVPPTADLSSSGYVLQVRKP
jgi:hypothetical protein